MGPEAGARRGDKPHLRQRSARGWELTFTTPAGFRDTVTIHARNKSEAGRLRDDYLAHQERIRLGLENAIQLVTLEEAFKRYSETATAKKSWPQESGRWRLHILETDEKGQAHSKLAKKLLHQITSADIEGLLVKKLKEGQAPRSVRQLKAHLGRLFSWAIRKARLLRGENPAWLAEMPCAIPAVTPKAMSEAQLEQLLTRGFEDFETFFLLLFDTYTGLRRGELCGLAWDNVHEDQGYVWVERSFSDTTKGKRARNMPIHPVLLPYIRYARKHARSELVFPGQDGKMRPTWWDAANVFRTCLKRAGLIKGWIQECRPRRGARTGAANPRSKLSAEQVADIRKRAKAGETHTEIAATHGVARQVVLYHVRTAGLFRPPGGCGYASELLPEAAPGDCPTCGAPLLARAIPLDFTLKDLRSSFGSYVVESTGGLRAAQLFLGHKDEDTTDRHYAHRRDSFLQAQMAQVRIVDADRLPTAFTHNQPRLSASASKYTPKRRELPPVTTRGDQ